MASKRTREKSRFLHCMERKTTKLIVRRFFMNQQKYIQQMSDEDLTKSIIYSQLLLLILAIGLSFLLFSSFKEWLHYFHWDSWEIFYYGFVPGLILVSLNVVVRSFVPKKYYDDGGINERIFKNKSIPYVFGMVCLVAVCEELLFRGVVQTTFGYIFASSLFALVHYRYLRKPFLLAAILLTSFYIG